MQLTGNGSSVAVVVSTPPPAAGSRSSRFRPDIEGLRAIAVLLVVLFHAGFPFLPGGYVGVDVFFVISGFLITGLLLREVRQTGRLSFTSFYARRARRLLPMATTVLMTTLVASFFILSEIDVDALSIAGTAAATFWSNWYFGAQANDYFATDVTTSPVLHFWSLSVEEQFYFVWPLLLVLVVICTRGRTTRRTQTVAIGLALLLVTGASLLWSVLGTASLGNLAYYGLQTRLWELGFGAGIALAAPLLRTRITPWVSWVAGWAGLALIFFAAIRFNEHTVFPGRAALAPVVGASLVIVAGMGLRRHRLGAGRVLGIAPMQYIGARSYNLYLWHWPALVLIGTLLASPADFAELSESTVATPGAAAVALAIAAVLTVLTYRFIEQPARRAQLLQSSRVMLPAAAAAIVATVLLALSLPSLATSATTATEHSAGVNAAAIRHARTLVGETPWAEDCQGSSEAEGAEEFARVQAEDCVFGDPNGDVRLALVGDSHAGMWLPALDRIGKDQGWQIDYWSKNACWYPLQSVDPDAETRVRTCPDWNRLLLEQLREDGPFDAVILARSQATSQPKLPNGPSVEEQLVATFGELAAVTKQIVVLGDPVRAATDVPRCLLRNDGDPTACQPPRDKGLAKEAKLVALESKAAQAVADRVQVLFVPTADLFCEPGLQVCPIVDANGVVMYRDQHHLSIAAATAAIPRLRQLLDRSVNLP